MKNFYLRVSLLFVVLSIGIISIQAEDILSKAEAELTAGIQTTDLPKITAAVRQIVGLNTEKSARVLTEQLNKISTDNSDVYWAILKGFPLFTNTEVLEIIATFIISNKAKPVGRDALFIMKDNQSPGMVKLLSRILEKGNRGLHVLALDYLSGIKSKIAVSALIEFLKNPDCLKEEDLKERTIASINALIGKPVGQTPEEIDRWWTQHQNDEEKTLFTPPEVTPEPTATTDTAADGYVQIDLLRRIKPEQIVVVLSDCKGCEGIGKMPDEWDHNFDHIEHILMQMKIPHIVVKKSEFDKENFKLNDRIAVIFNCNNIRKHCICPNCKWTDKRGGLRSGTCALSCDRHILYANILSEKGIEKIREFVAGGGYLFSEDWVLEEVLERAFKGVLSHSKYYLKERDVTVLPAPGVTTHPYLKGVFEKHVTKSEKPPDSNPDEPSSRETMSVKKRLNVGDGNWKIDKDSPDVRITNPKVVTVLMIAPKLKATPKDSGVVAVTFGFGGKAGPNAVVTPEGESNGGYISAKRKTGGQVLHVLSHFGEQHEPTDEFVLQNLMLNFLTEAAERYFSNSKK